MISRRLVGIIPHVWGTTIHFSSTINSSDSDADMSIITAHGIIIDMLLPIALCFSTYLAYLERLIERPRGWEWRSSGPSKYIKAPQAPRSCRWQTSSSFLFMTRDKDMGIMDSNSEKPKMPPRFVDLKSQIVPQDDESRKALVDAWNVLLVKLKDAVEELKREGSNVRVSGLTG